MQGAPKLRVAIVGSGLAGLSTAVELLDQGYEVDIYESRPWIGGKVASFQDKDGNHIEMGLHVFFGCYFNLFRLMAKCGVLENLLLKEHTHTFVNAGGDVRELDFRFFVGDTKIGAPFHGLRAFFTTPQLTPWDKAANALALGTSPVVRSLIDPEGVMRDVRAVDSVSFTTWFKSHGGSQASIDRMWDPIGAPRAAAALLAHAWFFFCHFRRGGVLAGLAWPGLGWAGLAVRRRRRTLPCSPPAFASPRSARFPPPR